MLKRSNKREKLRNFQGRSQSILKLLQEVKIQLVRLRKFTQPMNKQKTHSKEKQENKTKGIGQTDLKMKDKSLNMQKAKQRVNQRLINHLLFLKKTELTFQWNLRLEKLFLKEPRRLSSS